jgi:hypothetical protein
MSKVLINLIVLLLFMVQPSSAQLQDYIRKYVEDESAPGARAAMGLLAAGYGKALADEVFDLPLNTWQNRLTSIGIAALSYQIISYDTYQGLQINPFKFNKEWTGYWEGYVLGEGLDLFLGFVNRYDSAKFIIASTVTILMSIVVVKGQQTGGFRMADDGPFSFDNVIKNRHSWWVHFAASGGLYWAISNHTVTEESALYHTLPVIWLWEVKDGFLPWEKYGWIGGDGFSWRDGVAGSIAAVGSYAIDKWVYPFIRDNMLPKTGANTPFLEVKFAPDLYRDEFALNLEIRF